MADERKEWIVMVTPEEKLVLLRLLGEMRREAPVAAAFKPGRHFLRTTAQLAVYRTYVRAYYFNNIAERKVSHKLRMLHFAAIYHVIAMRTGIESGCFWGPEYDRFLVDYCKVPYNESNDRKGRYRQVGDVYKRYAAHKGEPKLQAKYDGYLKEFYAIVLPDRKPVSYSSARVPQSLEDALNAEKQT